MADDSVISVEYLGRMAVVTIDNAKKLNALSQVQYYALSQAMREVAAHDEVFVTVLTAKGRYFSAGADVSAIHRPPAPDTSTHQHFLDIFVTNNLNITEAFFSHPKVLVVGLNGPVVGLTAALVSHADFIYCTPQTFLLTPFSSLGLAAEGGASRALVQRLGLPKANEALIMSKPIPATELLATGFVNAIFEVAEGEGRDARFRERLLREVHDRLGEHLIGESLVGIKKLIRDQDRERMEAQSAKEVWAGLERFVKGVPQEEFRKIATGQKRHKL